MMATRPACIAADCDKAPFRRGLCRKHYARFRRHGDPEIVTRPMAPRGAPLAWLREHVDHQGAACLMWPFARYPNGRAHMSGPKNPNRLMCEMVHGPSPSPDHEAAHSCGKAHLACVHPQHLRWATPKENSDDKLVHGTISRGESHARARVGEEQVRVIRDLASVKPLEELATMFGLSSSNISRIVNRKTWRHVA